MKAITRIIADIFDITKQFPVKNEKIQDIYSCAAFKKHILLSTVLCVSILSFYSCKPEEPVAPQVKKPYCYWENGKQVCYESPK